MLVTLAYHILLYLQILIDKVGLIVQVGHNASHMSGCQHYSVGLFLIEKRLDCRTIQQIEFFVAAPHQIRITSFPEVIPDSGAY